ncbi:hypothetical protein GCM10020220_003140 [Nonomuraea rubra]|uniref:hypothetical protein n=1 Tax=Nonomuraea rubra TaxID=46180 RepID=UPI0031E8D2F8
MADEPKTQDFPLRYGDQPIDTSVREAGFMESMFRDTIGEIRDMIDATDPAAVQLAGLYYQAAEPLLNEFAADLKTKAAELAEHYRGPAAYQTQLQLRSLHASVVELAGKLGAMGRSLKPYGDTLQWAQANVVEERGRDSRSDNDIDWADQIPFYGIKRSSDRATQHLREVNERIAQHYADMPVEVQQALPIVVDPEMPDFNNSGLRGPQVGPLNTGDVPPLPERLVRPRRGPWRPVLRRLLPSRAVPRQLRQRRGEPRRRPERPRSTRRSGRQRRLRQWRPVRAGQQHPRQPAGRAVGSFRALRALARLTPRLRLHDLGGLRPLAGGGAQRPEHRHHLPGQRPGDVRHRLPR